MFFSLFVLHYIVSTILRFCVVRYCAAKWGKNNGHINGQIVYAFLSLVPQKVIYIKFYKLIKAHLQNPFCGKHSDDKEQKSLLQDTKGIQLSVIIRKSIIALNDFSTSVPTGHH